jgi:hypothetical protein
MRGLSTLRTIAGLTVILAMTACGSGAIAPTDATYALTGTVRIATADGQAVEGASVRVLEPSLVGSPTVTDANGYYRFPALLAGRHLIEVSKPGFVIWETEFSVADRDLKLDVMLKIVDPATAAHD